MDGDVCGNPTANGRHFGSRLALVQQQTHLQVVLTSERDPVVILRQKLNVDTFPPKVGSKSITLNPSRIQRAPVPEIKGINTTGSLVWVVRPNPVHIPNRSSPARRLPPSKSEKRTASRMAFNSIIKDNNTTNNIYHKYLDIISICSRNSFFMRPGNSRRRDARVW